MYELDVTDPRVARRVLRVLKFMCAQVHEHKPRQLSRVYLDKIFGKQGNPLTGYLRSKCLIVCDSSYRFTTNACARQTGRDDKLAYCKTYRMNIEGVNELITAMKLPASDLVSETKRIVKSECNSNNAYCATSFAEDVKLELALDFARSEFGGDLATNTLTYHSGNSPRLYHNVQNLKKAVKHQLYSEYNYAYEYDIESAAPTLLYQHARSLGMKPMAHIEFLLTNKRQVRQDLADFYAIPLDVVKEVINAIFAGARFDRSIAAKINNPTKTRALANNQFITDLKRDISKMWQVIKRNDQLVHGARYKRDGSREKKMSSKSKWDIYFTLERSVLDVVREYLRVTGNRCILEHDGWTTQNPVDMNTLNELVKEQTGFVIKTSEVKLQDVVIISCT